MRLGGIGIGQAGGKVLDLLAYHDRYGIHNRILPFAIALNSAQADLQELKNIPKANRILVGQTQLRGHGTGLLRDIGTQVVDQQSHLIMRTIADQALHRVDAFLIIAGLGGGTGSGGAPIIAEQLKAVHDEPVYVLGILPSSDEGNLMTGNARAALNELDRVCDGILLFDNDIWKKEGVALQECYSFMNHEMVKPLPFLMSAGEVTGERVGIKVVDASDIIATWHGLAYIGFSELKARTWHHKLKFLRQRSSIEQLDPVLACLTVVKNAASMRLTGRCNAKKATNALMLLSGPDSELNMEGFARAKGWLQEYIGSSAEIRGGDYPLPHVDELSGTVLLGGFHGIERLNLVQDTKGS